MQNFTAQFWDAKTLNDLLQAGLERQKTAQFEQDRNLAVTEAVRSVSNAFEHYAVCQTQGLPMTQRDVPSTPAGAASRPALQASRQRPFNRDGIGKKIA